MSFLLILVIVLVDVTSTTMFAYRMEFKNSTDPFCLYFDRSIGSSLDVQLHLLDPARVCHRNISYEKSSNASTNDILILLLAENCSIAQQWTIIKDTSWLNDYFALVLTDGFDRWSIDGGSSSIRIGRIDQRDALEFSKIPNKVLLSRLDRERIRFDLSIGLFVAVLLCSMLIGNEWHRQVFVQRIIAHCQEQRETRNVSILIQWRDACLINVLLAIGFLFIFLLLRYPSEFTMNTHRVGVFVMSAFVIHYYLDFCLRRCFQRFFETNSLYQQCSSVLLLVSVIFVLLSQIYSSDAFQQVSRNVVCIGTVILIISQMRLVNFFYCLILFTGLFLFECSFFIQRILQFDSAENDDLDYYLSGGIRHVIERSRFEWLVREKLVLLFTFSEFQGRKDGCTFDKGHFYFSMEDLIFPSLLFNFCRIFDLGNSIRFPIYYVQVWFSYLLALSLSYLTMIYTKYDRLLSLFIYPMILLSTLITASLRGECRKLFQGTLSSWKKPFPAPLTLIRQSSF